MKIEIPKIMERYGGDLVTKLSRLIDGHISGIHTTTIGVIESFDSDKQIANIQPAIKRVISKINQDNVIYTTEDYPLLVNVPIVFPGGGDWFMTFPVKKGDECLIFSMERSIGNWKKNGGVQEPSNYRRKLSFKDAIAMVGLNSSASSLPSFNASEPELRNRDGDVKLTMTNTGIDVEGDLSVTGDITATGDIIADSDGLIPISLKDHVHGFSGSPNGDLANASGPVLGATSPPERVV